MKFNRTQNASRNIIFGLLQRVYQLIVPFIMRTAMIYRLGMEYIGLDGLFTSILSVLNLAELGVGSAMIYSMYKPVAEDDRTRICALMRLYKIYYRVIGIIVLIAGLVVCPFVPKLISGRIPDGLNVYILFVLNLSATVLSYWLFAYKNSILQAYQRADVVSKVTMLVSTGRYLVQFALLFFLHNYYAYLIVTLLSQAVINVVTAITVERMYPGLDAKGELSRQERKEINHRIRDLFTAKMGSIVVGSADTLVISAFLGLTVLAKYQNYYFIVTAILSIINIFIFSCMSGIGNSIIVESKEKNFADFRTLTFLIVCIATVCTSCLINLYQPFMEIWVGRENMFEMPAVVCFGVYFFIVQVNTLLNAYKDAAGMWHEDRFRPLATAIANLSMNLAMVKVLGVYGILLSTVLSMMLVGMPWLIHNLFTTVFEKKNLRAYLGSLFLYASAAIFVAVITAIICNRIPMSGFPSLILKGVVCVVISASMLVLVFRKHGEFANAMKLADRITGNRLKLYRLAK